MKKVIIFVLSLCMATLCAAQWHKDTINITYEQKKRVYIKMNSDIQCPLDCRDKQCKLREKNLDKRFLARWKKMFKHLNYIYTHKIKDIKQVSPEFLQEFESVYRDKKEKQDYVSYSTDNQRDGLHISMTVINGEIVNIHVYVQVPPIPCCNKDGEVGAGVEAPDYRVLNYLKVKIPLITWDDHMSSSIMFGWQENYYQN